MASIIFGGGITNAVGSMAGNTFARNKGGAYMKKKSHGTNPRSSLQMAHRTEVGRLAKYYTYTLTDGDRAAWTAYAATNPVINRMGNTIFLSPQAMFIKLQSNGLQVGGPTFSAPPASGAIANVLSIAITPTADPGGSLFVKDTTTAPGPNDVVKVYASPPMAPGRAFIGSQLRGLDGSILCNTNTDVSAKYLDHFGLFPTAGGQRIFVRARVINSTNGIASALMQANTLWV